MRKPLVERFLIALAATFVFVSPTMNSIAVTEGTTTDSGQSKVTNQDSSEQPKVSEDKKSNLQHKHPFQREQPVHQMMLHSNLQHKHHLHRMIRQRKIIVKRVILSNQEPQQQEKRIIKEITEKTIKERSLRQQSQI